MEAMNFEDYVKIFLERAKDPEVIARNQEYNNEKKKAFFFEIDNGIHGGAFFYRMIFKNEVSRREFRDIMEKAQQSDNRYADLYKQSFRDEHGIEDVEGINPDFQDMLEEKYWCTRRNPETGEIELVDEDEYEGEDEDE